ncbi:hypothetical protein [Trueperella pyogenes]
MSHEPKSLRTEGADAAWLAEQYGLSPDPWQYDVLESWFAVHEDGKLAAAQCGLAVPRQNGKNGILEMVELYKIVVQGRKILHTAHEVKTARKAFLRLASFFEDDRLYPELHGLVKSIRRTNGQESIELRNGGSVEFIARSKGSGRGFTADDLVCDEAQDLNDDELAALMPTISASPSGDPQIIFTGTPPAPDALPTVFRRIRANGVSGEVDRLSWREWSVSDDFQPDKYSSDELASFAWDVNPALGIRLNATTIYDESRVMSPEVFARERLGQWSETGVSSSLPARQWRKQLDELSTPGEHLCFGLDLSPLRDSASITAVSKREDDRYHVELVEHRVGTDWVASRAKELQEKWTPDAFVVDAGSAAGALVGELLRARVRVTQITGREYLQACGLIFDAFQRGELAHIGQEPLNEAVANVQIKGKGESLFTWARIDPLVPLGPWAAATLAFAGVNKTQRPEKSKNNGWKVVAL